MHTANRKADDQQQQLTTSDDSSNIRRTEYQLAGDMFVAGGCRGHFGSALLSRGQDGSFPFGRTTEVSKEGAEKKLPLWLDCPSCLSDEITHRYRIPIAQVDCLELPAGMMDDDTQTIQGVAVHEMEEECGIVIDASELVDLTRLAFEGCKVGSTGVPLSQGGCDERMRFLYLEKHVTQAQLDQMRNRLTGLREEGEVITLRVVPYDDVWRISADSKAIM